MLRVEFTPACGPLNQTETTTTEAPTVEVPLSFCAVSAVDWLQDQGHSKECSQVQVAHTCLRTKHTRTPPPCQLLQDTPADDYHILMSAP